MWYGTPLISFDNLLITTVNSIGAVFQFVYTILFMVHAEKEKKVAFLNLNTYDMIMLKTHWLAYNFVITSNFH